MREEEHIEGVQRTILRSKKWYRFAKHFDLGTPGKHVWVDELPVRFVHYIPAGGNGYTHAIMECRTDQILVNAMFYDFLSERTLRLFLMHELVHHYLRENEVNFSDDSKLFRKALRYLGIDHIVKVKALYRPRDGPDRRWRS